MALKDMMTLIDAKLADVFHTKAYDPSADRAWVVGRLEATKTQFQSTETTRGGGKKWWQLNNGIVAFSPTRRDKTPLVINGQTTVFVPSEHFLKFNDHMISAVNAGEFDKELKADTTNGTSVHMNTKPRAPRKPREGGSGGGKGWSPERAARYAETIAARRAAKGSTDA